MDIAHEVAEIFDHIFGDRKSLIDPSVDIWTATAAEELRACVEDNPRQGTKLSLWEKLDEQLTGASKEAILLAAEIVFLREHIQRYARSDTRTSHVKRVLKHLDYDVDIPEQMHRWLSRPTGQAGWVGGSNYNMSAWLHIIGLSTFIRDLDDLSDGECTALEQDPWALHDRLLATDNAGSDICNAFLFLRFPEVFEPISAESRKRTVRDGLAKHFGDTPAEDVVALDRDLLRYRVRLTEKFPGEFSFFDEPLRELWESRRKKTAHKNAASAEESAAEADIEEIAPEPRERNYWLIAPGHGAEMWQEFYEKGIVAVAWDELGNFGDYIDQDDIRQELENIHPATAQVISSLAVWQFGHEMRPGDVVFARNGRKELIGRGKVTSDLHYDDNRESYRNYRSVDWTHQGSWTFPVDSPTKTLTKITDRRDYVELLEELIADSAAIPLVDDMTSLPPYGKEDFLSEVFLSEDKYDRLAALVSRKKNVILAGPPGVGKTFVAKRLAQAYMGVKDPERIKIIQFHQNYAYEDFMMGFRPTVGGGFELTEGPFYRFCEKAREDDPSRPYFFIIDEINRGNISKIFGELLMLIEADKRGEKLRLQYRDQTFSVPENVHLVGTMNTADRSLAVLDYALRRRFGFFAMEPGFDSEGFLRLKDSVNSTAFEMLISDISALNLEISEDPALGSGFQIGHSFFANAPEMDTESWLTSIVEYELIPLLDEYWFDEPDRAIEWTERLRQTVQ